MKKILIALSFVLLIFALASCKNDNEVIEEKTKLALAYSFNETVGNQTLESVSNTNSTINYVFNESNYDKLFKAPSDPILRKGVNGNALYMDGFSTKIRNNDFIMSSEEFTLSAWVAPRVFENINNYNDYDEYGRDTTMAKGHSLLTAVINQGDVSIGEGFVFGYGRLGLWGLQMALRNNETDEEFVVGFYDPINTLELYEWNHISATFNGKTGYISLSYNGVVSYESIIPELVNSELIISSEPLYIGYYINPISEYGIERQMPAGLLDEVEIYSESLTPKAVKNLFEKYSENGLRPQLPFSEISLDFDQYLSDRFRPQYHGLPPATWMNEPHSPFYYNGRYHVLYQHNPSGPYWSQIRWGHLVSDDMIHWEFVKDAVVPTKDICPEGVWTGGAVIGPDNTPWLVITAGTNRSTWSGQNIAFAHCVDPTDKNLTEWVVEDVVTITQPSDDSQGERDQFRDPFVWYDDGVYYMLISTSIPGRGGSANIYTSTNLHEWESKGYFFECDYEKYPEQGAHWECVVMLPISTKDGKTTKYIVFDCPQYTVDGYIVDCYYWIGSFDKENCRFIPDDPKPRLFDLGRGCYTGQNGYCFLTDEMKANGLSKYEDGRTVIYAIAQGKDSHAVTSNGKNVGWAHNFAIPLELYLADNGYDVIREPIKEIESLYDETLYEYSGEGLTVDAVNDEISQIRGDMLRIDLKITLDPKAEDYTGGLYVRYNPNETTEGTERTLIAFSNQGVYVDRTRSSLLDVTKNQSYTWPVVNREYTLTILLDRSMLEIYVDGIISFTTRVHPKYGNSDYLRFLDGNSGLIVKELKIINMKSAYTESVVPAWYGNVGNLGE